MALHHTSRTSAAHRIVNRYRRWGDYSRRSPLREGRIENSLYLLSEQPERQAGGDGDRVARRHMYALDNRVAGFDPRLEVILRFEISLIGLVINRKIEVHPAAQPLVDARCDLVCKCGSNYRRKRYMGFICSLLELTKGKGELAL